MSRASRKSSVRVMGALVAVTLAAAVLPQSDAAGRERCASSLVTSLYLTDHHPRGPFYVATESQGGSFTVLREGDNCADGEWTDAYFSLRPETTSAGDLSPPSGKVRLYAPTDTSHPGENERTVDVDVTGEIDGVEKAVVRLDESEHSGQDSPVYYNRAAPFYVVDTDSPSSIVVGENSLRVNEALTVRIPVFRTGPISGDKTVPFRVVPGSARPGEDYEEPSSTSVTFAGGSRVEVVSIRTLQDDFKEGDETFP